MERHITLDRNMWGSDEKALGDGIKKYMKVKLRSRENCGISVFNLLIRKVSWVNPKPFFEHVLITFGIEFFICRDKQIFAEIM